jgi:glycosyltransferase involved in cell wall biosynthesis
VLDALELEPDLPCRLTVVGGGEGGPLAEKAARDPRIRLAGALPPAEVRRAYEKSHGFVFPSRVDVFGLALVEAMAAGLPAAVSDLPGATADLGRSAHNCLGVPAHEPGAWARALKRLVEDRALRVRLGGAARLTIRRRWTMEHAVDAMVAGLRLGALQAAGAERRA